MDISSLMNNDGAQATRPLQQPPPPQQQAQVQQLVRDRDAPRNTAFHPPPPPRSSSGNFGSPTLQHHQQHAQKPAPPQPFHYAPQSEQRPSNPSIPPRSSHLTPLHTPSQAHAGSGYPFPSHYQSPSPAQPPPPSLRGPDPYAAVTPGGSRPSVPVYQYGQPSQSPYGPPSGHPAQYQSASHSSMSPTPPTHHQPPHSVRESSMSVHPSAQYPMPGPQHSQPSTPLGPPSGQYPRSSVHNQREMQSPYGVHHRSLSGTSYGAGQSMASNSPASRQNSGHMAESPAVYGPPGQYKRPSGDFLASMERERSVSVSPKTTVIRRHPSSDSRYGSQDPTSARGSFSEIPSAYDRSSHHPSQPAVEPRLRSSGDMSSNTAISPMTRPTPSTMNAPPATASPVVPRVFGSQTPQLKSLLNDSIMPASPMRQSPASHPGQSPGMQQHVPNGGQFSVALPVKNESSSGFAQGSLLQQPLAPNVSMVIPPAGTVPVTPTLTSQAPPVQTPVASEAPEPRSAPQTMTQKRPAESEPERSTPAKKVKKRYAEPPIWARFHTKNPRFDPNNPQHRAPLNPPPQAKRPSPRAAHRAAPTPPVNGQHLPPTPAAQPNGDNRPALPRPTNGVEAQMKARASAMLGPWEVSLTDTLPVPDIVKVVGDYLMHEMLTRGDVGVGDARNGALEIEAKLGTLCDRHTGGRIRFPLMTATVLDPGWSKENVRFESKMTEAQHKTMNEFLNKRTQESMQPGRVKMEYKHRYERDTFASLSQTGVNALPAAARNYMQGRHNPRLRTSFNSRPKAGENPLLARIVKIRLADLDILSPFGDFDCRISVNIEVDMLNRPDIDPTLIVEAPEREREPQSERQKDRVSYKHLAYSVDLTQVILQSGEKSHELEVEVDAVKLREHAVRASENQPNAYAELVEGLMNNVFLLARVRG